MDRVETLNIKIKTTGIIKGNIDKYKYNMNTNLNSKNSTIYIPTKYNLKKNASKRPKLKDISLYTDKSKLEEFIKDSDTENNVLDSNIKFIIELLFKKNSKFYIKKWQFIIDKTPDNTVGKNDIEIQKKTTSELKSDKKIQRDALKNKFDKIKEEVEIPYLSIKQSLSDDYKKQFKRNIDREILSRYNKFLLNKTEREEWINKYKLKLKANKVTVTLNLIPGSLELVKWINTNGYKIDQKYRPRARDCKTKKLYINDEFLELLCNSSEIPDDTPEMKKYKKRINKVRRFTRKYIANPIQDIPACKKYINRKDNSKKNRKQLTIDNLRLNLYPNTSLEADKYSIPSLKNLKSQFRKLFSV